MNWGDYIKQIRLKMGLNKKEFAKLLDTTDITIIRWELHGATPMPVFQTKLRELAEKVLG